MADVFALYRKLYEEGVAAPAAKDEAGPTWLGALQSGKIGIAPGPAVWLGLIESKANFKLGVAPISGINGGESTFVGGDSLGIGATTTHADQAWDFLSWTLSDEAQVEVVAKNKGVPVRTDLAANKYSSADPRIVKINNLMAKGRTPYAKNFNATYNDPQSPWIATFRGAYFGDAQKALNDGAAALTASLKKS
jgi:multiple sugar transport system substrate-binding protein